MTTYRYEPRPAVRDVDDLGGERARAIVQLVLTELDLQPDWSGERAEQQIQQRLTGFRRVREMHSPARIYDDCGHRHSLYEGGEWAFVEGVGMVCQQGWQYTVCRCCCLDSTGHQTEDCVVDHHHDRDSYCATVNALTSGDTA